MTQTPIGIGIVGSGFLAATRARCYAKIGSSLATIRGVCSGRRDNAEKYAREYGVPEVFASLEEMLASPQIDMVDLCVPNLLHRSMAEQSAAAGKHVACTKPLSAYVGQDLGDDPAEEAVSATDRATMMKIAIDDAQAMVDAARANDVQLMYGENWVYAPAIVRAERLIAASRGAILEMRGWEGHNGSHSPYSKIWKYAGGGALLRLGAHPLGAMLHLKRVEGRARNGAPIRPVAVTAEVADLTASSPVDGAQMRVATGWKDVENWGCAIVQFEDGTRGTAYGSDNMLGGMESKLEVHASNHHLKCNLSPHDLLRAYAPDAEVFGDEYIMEKIDSGAGWSTPLPAEDWASGQLPMIEDFVRAVAEGRPARSDGELGREVTELVYAAYLSAAEGRRVTL